MPTVYVRSSSSSVRLDFYNNGGIDDRFSTGTLSGGTHPLEPAELSESLMGSCGVLTAGPITDDGTQILESARCNVELDVVRQLINLRITDLPRMVSAPSPLDQVALSERSSSSVEWLVNMGIDAAEFGEVRTVQIWSRSRDLNGDMAEAKMYDEVFWLEPEVGSKTRSTYLDAGQVVELLPGRAP